MELHLKIIGYILVLLAIIHVIFPWYFNWKKEFMLVSLVNKQIMYVHTFFIALVILLIAIICLSSSKELIETNLGKKVCLGIGVFWTVRLFIQFFYYSSKLWKGKTFETTVHVLFTFLWTYLSFIFCKIAWA